MSTPAPQGRIIADAVLTEGVATLTSAAGGFSSNSDAGFIGAVVTGPGIAEGTTVTARPSSTTLTLSQPATASGTDVTVTLNPFPMPYDSTFRAFYTVWMTIEEDTGDVFVLDSHYLNEVGERPASCNCASTTPPSRCRPSTRHGGGRRHPGARQRRRHRRPQECTNPGTVRPPHVRHRHRHRPGRRADDMIYVTDAWNRQSYRSTRTPRRPPRRHPVALRRHLRPGPDRRRQARHRGRPRAQPGVLGGRRELPGRRVQRGTATTPPATGVLRRPGRRPRAVRRWRPGHRHRRRRQRVGGRLRRLRDREVLLPRARHPPPRHGPPPAPARRPPEGLLGQPRDVAVDDETGDVWVADTWNQRFVRFSSTGVHLGTWGTVGLVGRST